MRNKKFWLIFTFFLLFPGFLVLPSCGKKYDINIVLSGALDSEYISSVSLPKAENGEYRASLSGEKSYQFEIVYKNGYDITDIYINGKDDTVDVRKESGEEVWGKIVVTINPTRDRTYNLIVSEPTKMVEAVEVEGVDEAQITSACERNLLEEMKIYATHSNQTDFYPLSCFTGENASQYKLIFDLTNKTAKFNVQMPNMFKTAALGSFAKVGDTYFSCQQDKNDSCLYTFSIALNSTNYTQFKQKITFNFDFLENKENYKVFGFNEKFDSSESDYKFLLSSNGGLIKEFGQEKTYTVSLDRTHYTQEYLALLDMLDLSKVVVCIGDEEVQTRYNDIDENITFSLANCDLPCDYGINGDNFAFSIKNLQLKRNYVGYDVSANSCLESTLAFDGTNLNMFRFDVDDDVKTLHFASKISPTQSITFKTTFDLLSSIYSTVNIDITFVGNNYVLNDIDVLELLNSKEDKDLSEDILISGNTVGITFSIDYKSEDKKIYIQAIYENSNFGMFNGVQAQVSGEQINYTIEFKSSDFQTSDWAYQDLSLLNPIVNNKVTVAATYQKEMDFSVATILQNVTWNDVNSCGMKISYFCDEEEVQPNSAILIERGGSMSAQNNGISIKRNMHLTSGPYYVVGADGTYEIITNIVCDFVKNT